MKNFDLMESAQCLAASQQNLLDLQSAAWIRAGQKIGLRGEDVVGFARADFVRALGLDEVVDPGAAATLIAVGNLQELQLRDSTKQLSWCAANPLGMREVTGIVIRNARFQRVAFRDRR